MSRYLKDNEREERLKQRERKKKARIEENVDEDDERFFDGMLQNIYNNKLTSHFTIQLVVKKYNDDTLRPGPVCITRRG